MQYKASVIIVSYNNYKDTTGPCIESICSDTPNKNIEIIVVDNNSTDETPEKLREFAKKNSNLKPLLNTDNRGFAGGNNDGVAMATGEILILLNSDTIIPTGMLNRIVELMLENSDWGMLGPVTNEAGNEQKIPVQSGNVDEIIDQGLEWCRHADNDYFITDRLDFCCVALRTVDYRRLGGLDEGFGRGYYEDDDFCIRARLAGLKMVMAEEVFICHLSGKSFSKFGNAYVKKLMRANKAKLKKKHGRNCRFYHVRKQYIKLLRQYAERKKHLSDVVQLQNLDYRFRRRMLFAQSLYPNNPLKKLIYALQLGAIDKKYNIGAP